MLTPVREGGGHDDEGIRGNGGLAGAPLVRGAGGALMATAVKTRDGVSVPAVGEVWSVQGHLFEVTAVHPEPTWGVKERQGVFTGKALDPSLVGTGYDGGNYSY